MEPIPKLDNTGLRRFGITFGLIFISVFGVLLPLLFGLNFRLWPWLTGGFFVFWAVLAAASLNGFYQLWMRLGFVLNAVMSRLVLGIVFFCVVLPTGLVLKLRGQDPMQRKADANAVSYRVISKQTSKNNMEKPF